MLKLKIVVLGYKTCVRNLEILYLKIQNLKISSFSKLIKSRIEKKRKLPLTTTNKNLSSNCWSSLIYAFQMLC